MWRDRRHRGEFLRSLSERVDGFVCATFYDLDSGLPVRTVRAETSRWNGSDLAGDDMTLAELMGGNVSRLQRRRQVEFTRGDVSHLIRLLDKSAAVHVVAAASPSTVCDQVEAEVIELTSLRAGSIHPTPHSRPKVPYLA